MILGPEEPKRKFNCIVIEPNRRLIFIKNSEFSKIKTFHKLITCFDIFFHLVTFHYIFGKSTREI